MKKLALNRETLRSLDLSQVEEANGAYIILPTSTVRYTMFTCGYWGCGTRTISGSAIDACPSALGCTLTIQQQTIRQ